MQVVTVIKDSATDLEDWAVTISSRPMLSSRVKKKFNFVEMSDKEFLEEDSYNTHSKQFTKSTEEVTNPYLFSLLKTYMNDNLKRE